MRLPLGRRTCEDVRVPPPAEFLDARDVDRPVVEEVLDLRELGAQKAPVGPDRVTAERNRSGFADVRSDERQGLLAGLGERDRGGLDRRQQPRPRMHGAHHAIHRLELLGCRVNNDIGAFGDRLELIIGDHGGDLDDHVPRWVEAGHLQVHPGEHDPILNGIEPGGGHSPDPCARAGAGSGGRSWGCGHSPITSPLPQDLRYRTCSA